ncbi:class I mannose-6-phosphate isomerase [Streptomyces sp. NBC_01497]|uniref:class I mannose-6-phosphate isomerase n=1 Tax=Streptomyces sp. NBC_01497 TaxID=2903885 RepID=UPI002E30BC7A|nr:hypothetical protein [Streptomyces sp. NBC_01497]
MRLDGGDRPYEPNPRYAAIGSSVQTGWSAAVEQVEDATGTLAVDGPWSLDWERVRTDLAAALPGAELIDVRTYLAPWETIRERTDADVLADDPHFARLTTATLADFFGALPEPAAPAGTRTVVFGPGAGLVGHDTLWYVDLPKRYAEAAVAAGTGSTIGLPRGEKPGTRRLFYIDWPVLDRHRDALAPRVDRWFDLQDPARPVSLSGDALRATAAELSGRPFRTRPTFNTTPWGGQWARRELGFNPEGPNTALGYELIAPESGVLVGDGDACLEIPFQLLVALAPERVMGARVHEMFGTSFPIRFDYLDTVAGGSLSVHCHPQSDYMREVFGWPYTQHETYYMMVGGEQNKVYLGLRGDVDVDRFHDDVHHADSEQRPFDIEDHVQTFPAREGQLFLVPAGTPHGSGAGNVVLEVSATPYLYSLRFYDWLRRDARDRPRAVHVDHAFRNLNSGRTGEAVRTDLVQSPRTARSGDGWSDELLGVLPEMFFAVHRFDVDPGATAEDDTDGRFHILNVVDGAGVLVRTASGDIHPLHYAETLVVPAAVGPYTLTALGSEQVRVVKAFVR